MNKFSFFLIPLLLLVVVSRICAQEEWALQQEADGIRIYTRFRSDSAINEFKSVMRLKGNIDSAFSILADMSQITSTDPQTKEGRILHSVSPTEYYFYQVLEMPFLSDEYDLISHITIAKTASGYFLYGISDPDYLPRMAGVGRVEHSRLVISVRTVSRTTFELILSGSAELPVDAGIPKLAMNRALVGTMSGRMKRMQELLGLAVSQEP